MPTFIASGSVSIVANPTVAVPAGVAKNDLLLIVTTGSATPTTPTGWTQLAAQGAGQFITVLFRYATTSEASVTLTLAGTTSRAFMMCYRGAGAFQLSATFSTGTGTTATTNTLTTTYTNNFVLSIVANLAGATRTLSTPTGTTLISTNNTSTTLNGLMVSRETQAAAGTSTARSSTISISSAWSALQISFIDPRTVYWVGGNGTWATPGAGATGTNWADTSGGAGSKIIPTQNDAVIVNGSSGSPTITLSAIPTCASLTTTGATCTLASTGTLQLNGNMTLSATTTWSATGVMSITGTGTVTTNAVSIASPITINGVSQTVTLGGALTTTGVLTLTNGTLALNGFDANCLTFSGTGTTARSIAFGSNFVNITSTATATVLNCADVTNFTPTGAGGIKLTGVAGFAVTRTITVGTTGGSATTAPNIFVGFAGDTVAITTDSQVGDLNLNEFEGLFAPPAALTLYGSLFIGDFTLWTTGTGTITFAATSTGKTIKTAGQILYAVTFNGVGGGYSLSDELTLANTFTLSSGTFNANNQNVTASNVSITGLSSRTLNMGSGIWNITGTGTPWNAATPTNLTVNANTSTIVLSDTSTATKIFSGGSRTYYNLQIGNGGGIAIYTIDGNNTFNKISSNKTSAYTIRAAALVSGITVNDFKATGSPGNVLTLTVAGGNQGDFFLIGGGIVSGVDYLNVVNLNFTPAPSGTQKYVWYMGDNSTFGTNVTGGALRTSNANTIAYHLLSGTSWTVPSDWNSSNNNVYLIGGGGGGGGSVATSQTGAHVSGSGGGGGGFRSLTNLTLTSGNSVTYAIGAGGTAGAGSATTSTAAAGGTTTFASFSVGGGGGATTSTTNTTLGAAGIGTTFNGGAGGLGNGTTNATRAGGGGGGSGGINAAGANGGNSVTTTAGIGGAGDNDVDQYVSLGTIAYGDGQNGSISATNTLPAMFNRYGAGGGGAGVTSGVATTISGGAGTQGAIFITYTLPSGVQQSNFFLLQ